MNASDEDRRRYLDAMRRYIAMGRLPAKVEIKAPLVQDQGSTGAAHAMAVAMMPGCSALAPEAIYKLARAYEDDGAITLAGFVNENKERICPLYVDHNGTFFLTYCPAHKQNEWMPLR